MHLFHDALVSFAERRVIKMTRLGQMLVEDGRKEGVSKVNCLIKLLAAQNRTEDILKSAEDEKYQEQLFAEFNL